MEAWGHVELVGIERHDDVEVCIAGGEDAIVDDGGVEVNILGDIEDKAGGEVTISAMLEGKLGVPALWRLMASKESSSESSKEVISATVRLSEGRVVWF